MSVYVGLSTNTATHSHAHQNLLIDADFELFLFDSSTLITWFALLFLNNRPHRSLIVA